MDKSVLEQYTHMQQEEKDLTKRIYSLKDRIAKMDEKGYTVADSVSCGKKGKKSLGTKTVRGFPQTEYSQKKRLLKLNEAKLKRLDEDLLKKLNEVEDYIQSISDSRMRRVLRYRYIDNLSWQQVAFRMGKNHTADSCRKSHDRFMQEN